MVYFTVELTMNERILIIEDDQQILKLLQRGLAYEGYTVDTATDGRMGLILARDYITEYFVPRVQSRRGFCNSPCSGTGCP